MDTKFLRGQCVCSRPGLGFPFQASTLSPVPDSPLVTDLLSYSACRGFWDQRRLRSLGQRTHSTVQQEVTFPQRPLTGPPPPPPAPPQASTALALPTLLGCLHPSTRSQPMSCYSTHHLPLPNLASWCSAHWALGRCSVNFCQTNE